jgi:RNA polymerase sigma factor (sigma-70 family)
MNGHTIKQLLVTVRQTLDTNTSDGQLLERYRQDRDVQAFEAIVRKHSQAVFNTCRRVLRCDAAAEDAFQATFLVLMNNPGGVRKVESLGSWLCGVAHRTALRVRIDQQRRRRLEQRSTARQPAPHHADELSWHEAYTILHEELARLPDKYRQVLVHCYLEGQSRDEAASLLGLSINEVRGALERGRERLRKQLARRNVTLTVGLLGMLADSSFAESPPSAHLLQQACGTLPSSARAVNLARCESGTTLSSWTIGVAAMLVVGTLGLAIQLGNVHADPDKKDATPVAKSPRNEAPDVETFRGRVVDANGKPVAGAKLSLLYYSSLRADGVERAVTDAEGKYHFTVKRSEFKTDYHPEPWTKATLVAMANGHAMGWMPAGNHELRLPEQGELTGRLLTLEGKPIEGARVQVVGLLKPKAGDLSAWVKDIGKRDFDKWSNLADQEHLQGFDAAWLGVAIQQRFPAVHSDKDGRFRIPGIGKERVVDLEITHPNYETTLLKAMTRPFTAKADTKSYDFYYGNDFTLPLNPGRTVTGVVKDAKTGQPIRGATVYQFRLHPETRSNPPALRRPVVTDADGKYTTTGVPIRGENVLLAVGPQGSPYLPSDESIKAPADLGPASADFAMFEGVPLTVHAIDKQTRQPIKGVVRYYPEAQEGAGRFIGMLSYPEAPCIEKLGDYEGWKLFVPPGKGSIMFRALPGSAFSNTFGDAPFDDPAQQAGQHFFAQPRWLTLLHPHHTQPLEVKADQKGIEVTLEADAGQAIKGKIIMPNGKPLAPLLVGGLRPTPRELDWNRLETIKTAEFTVYGIRDQQPRLVVVHCPEHRLTGKALVTAQDKEVELRLVPWATVRGRLLDEAGEPLANVPIGNQRYLEEHTTFGYLVKPSANGWEKAEFIYTDAKGYFAIEGLTPGLNYRFRSNRMLLSLSEMLFKEGQDLNLGDIRPRTNP